jgi:hypothetical protein
MTPEHRMPVLFIGHDYPMNAIEETPFTAAWRVQDTDTSNLYFRFHLLHLHLHSVSCRDYRLPRLRCAQTS